MGCGLLKTALTHGWDVVLAEGPFEGLSGKYSAALTALNLALSGTKDGRKKKTTAALNNDLADNNNDGGNPDDYDDDDDGEDGEDGDALIVFTDSSDVLVQRSPSSVAAAFLEQPFEFVWSGEEACFPLGAWPHSLGHAKHVCDGLFPSTTTQTHGAPSLRSGPQFVNTGGWCV
jgi:hypothetical protein